MRGGWKDGGREAWLVTAGAVSCIAMLGASGLNEVDGLSGKTLKPTLERATPIKRESVESFDLIGGCEDGKVLNTVGSGEEKGELATIDDGVAVTDGPG